MESNLGSAMLPQQLEDLTIVRLLGKGQRSLALTVLCCRIGSILEKETDEFNVSCIGCVHQWSESALVAMIH